MGKVNGYELRFGVGCNQHSSFATINILNPVHYATYIAIARYPTGNCQLSSVAYVNCLLQATKKNKEDCNAILRECYRMMCMDHYLILMDVHRTYIKDVLKCFNVLHQHEYKSTNGSMMCLFLVRLQ